MTNENGMSSLVMARQMAFAGTAFGLVMGLYCFFLGAPLATLFPLTLLSGAAFGGAMYVFVKRQATKLPAMVAGAFASEEPVLRSGGANHFRGKVAVGGFLFLTGRRVRFISHSYNLKWNHDESFDLTEIVSIEEYNALGLVPNGLVLVMLDGRRERFVVSNRTEWIEAIHARRSSTPAGATAQLMGHIPESPPRVPKASAENESEVAAR